MNPILTAALISACLCGAVVLGMRLRRLLPEQHLNADTKDTVKLAMGLVATMSALLLGLLVVSALAVAGAILLILEMDRPFTRLVRVSGEPMVNALKQSPP